ncbi:MAG: hypothetical protein V8T64_01835 [Roseburia intestinalis]
MIKKRLLAGLLAVTLIWGCTGSAEQSMLQRTIPQHISYRKAQMVK